MTIEKIIEITDNNNPASVMHDDPREALAQVHALALAAAASERTSTEQRTSGGWAIDTSTGRPILVKNHCSVIEADDAYYVLSLLRRKCNGSTEDATTEFIRECHRRGISYDDVSESTFTDAADQNDPAALWAEIHRLRAELAGPDGFVTWKDAAITERRRRVEFERSANGLAKFCYIAKWRSESGHECMEVFNDIHPAREFLDLRGVVGQIVSTSLRGQGYVDALKGA